MSSCQENRTPFTAAETRDEDRQDRLPFDRREWAQTTGEAEVSLRRQYGREARGHADD